MYVQKQVDWTNLYYLRTRVCSSGFQQPRFTRRVEKIGRGLPGNRNRNQMRISSFSWLIIKFCQIALASSIFPMHGPGETNISLSRWYSLVWFKGTLTGTHGSTIGCFVPVNFPVNPNPFPYALCIFAYIWHSLVVNVGKIFQHHFSQMGIEANRFSRSTVFFPVNHKSYRHHTQMLHGAGIFTYITGPFWGYVLYVNIPAPWSIWDSDIKTPFFAAFHMS